MIITIKSFKESIHWKPSNLSNRIEKRKKEIISLIGQEQIEGDLEIEKWMLELDPKLFKIIEINGALDLQGLGLEKLPLWIKKIKYCKGLFLHHNKLTTLYGCPENIDGHFSCPSNNLSNLLFGPKNVTKNYYCWNNKLTTLKGLAEKINGNLYCGKNAKIFTIDDIPDNTEIKGNINFNH